MKQEQQQQAQHLYFQTDLSKTEIANILGISRRSLHYWVREQGWDRLKLSCNNMPSLIAENCYMIMSHLTDSILSDLRSMRPITKPEADTLRSLSLTIKNIKNRSTVNESLEMMSFFIEHVNSMDPEMALKIKPFISDYIATRGAVQPGQFTHPKLNDRGRIPVHEVEKPVAGATRTETQLDIEDIMAWSEPNLKFQLLPFLQRKVPKAEGLKKSILQPGQLLPFFQGKVPKAEGLKPKAKEWKAQMFSAARFITTARSAAKWPARQPKRQHKKSVAQVCNNCAKKQIKPLIINKNLRKKHLCKTGSIKRLGEPRRTMTVEFGIS